MIDKKKTYDSLDAFCAEYGFDAATTQRMRDDMLTTAPKTDIAEFASGAALAGKFVEQRAAPSNDERAATRWETTCAGSKNS